MDNVTSRLRWWYQQQQQQRTRACKCGSGGTGIIPYHVLAIFVVVGVAWYSYWYTHYNMNYLMTRRIDGELLYYRRIERVAEGNRTPVRPDEFFVKGPSDTSISKFFEWDETGALATIRLDPLWACSLSKTTTGTPERNHNTRERHTNGERKRKLIFLHMSRTAGSTVRGLLKAYAAKCRASVAIVSRCMDLNWRTMPGHELWRNGRDSLSRGQSCYLTHLSNRTDTAYQRSSTANRAMEGGVSSARLQEMQIDILMGKLSLGSDKYWSTIDSIDNTLIPTHAQYVVLLREPLHRFVSEVMSLHPSGTTLSIDESVQIVVQAASMASQDNRYGMHYSNYLITPQQKAWVEENGIIWTPQQRLNLTLKNLVESHVMVGLVEHMADSLELLRFLLDKENQLPEMFEFFSSSRNMDKLANVVTRNRTAAIVESIRNDPAVSPLLEDYIQYDQRIYDFAVQLHNQQMSTLRELTSPLGRV